MCSAAHPAGSRLQSTGLAGGASTGQCSTELAAVLAVLTAVGTAANPDSSAVQWSTVGMVRPALLLSTALLQLTAGQSAFSRYQSQNMSAY